MSPPLPSAPNGRTVAGKFAPGNRFGQGNPTLRRVHALRMAALEALEPEDMTRIIRKMAEAAAGGDVQAARLVLEYSLGRPTTTVALTGADGGPIGLEWTAVEGAIMAALESAPDEIRFGVALAIRGVVTDALDAE